MCYRNPRRTTCQQCTCARHPRTKSSKSLWSSTGAASDLRRQNSFGGFAVFELFWVDWVDDSLYLNSHYSVMCFLSHDSCCLISSRASITGGFLRVGSLFLTLEARLLQCGQPRHRLSGDLCGWAGLREVGPASICSTKRSHRKCFRQGLHH